MRKKSILIMLILTLLVLCGCEKSSFQKQSNEIFKLHSDVQFGMTSEEVIQQEKAMGIHLETAEHSLVWPKLESLESERTTVAGQADSTIYYVFDADKLTSCLYYYNDFVSFFTGEEVLESSVILEALTKKYGKPLDNSDGVFEVGTHFDALDQYYHMKKSGYYEGSRVSEMFYQWLYPVKDGYVDIMLLTLNTSNGESRIISYTFRTIEEVTKVLEKNESMKQQMFSDL